MAHPLSRDLERASPIELGFLCLRLRSERSAVHAEVCRAAARFHGGRGEGPCGYSGVGNYSVERLGVPASTFYSWARQGRLLE